MIRALFLFLFLLVFSQPIFAQDAAPTLSFERAGYWLVNPSVNDITLRDTDKNDDIKISLYRLTDPALLTQVMTARAARSLGEGELLRRVAEGAKPIWQGKLVPDATQPATKLPLDILAGQDNLPLGNGVYVVTAASGEDGAHATQWFMRSAIDISTKFYGRHALVTVYDMATRQPREKMQLVWLDAAGKALGKPVLTDATGTAWLDRPSEPAVLLMASQMTPDDEVMDMAFANVPSASVATVERALILPDKGLTGAGQTVSSLFVTPGYSNVKAKLAGREMKLTAIADGLYKGEGVVPVDARGDAIALELYQGDQLLARRTLAQSGNPDITLRWQQKPSSIVGDGKPVYKFRLLHNDKPLADKKGKLVVQPVTSADIDSAPVMGVVPLALDFTTDAKGEAAVTLDVTQFGAQAETAPSYAALGVTLNDAPVGARTLLSLYPARNWLEIIPGFADDAVAEGATARFTVRPGNSANAAPVMAAPLEWQLARESYKFEWYQTDDGRWTYRTNTALTPVSNGKVAFNGSDNSATIAVPVGAGRYRLTVTADKLTANMGFTAGWWLAPTPTVTPEHIALKAQMEKAGDITHLAVFVDPPFAARVWLTASSFAKAKTVVQDVPEDGGFIYIDQKDLATGQPLVLNAFAVPSKPEANLVQAADSVTLPVGLALTVTPDVVSARQPTALTIAGAPTHSKTIVQLIDKKDTLLYETAPLNVATDGALHVTLPPLATGLDADGAVTLRLITADDGRVSVTDKPLTNDGDIALQAMPFIDDAIDVVITARQGLKDKTRLTLVGGEVASVTVPALKPGQSLTVHLPLGAQKAGAKDWLLRLESGKGNNVLAARPLRAVIK